MANEQIGIVDVLRQRNATYNFLMRLFQKEVDAELFETLKGMRFPTRTGNAQVDDGYKLILSYLNHADTNVISDLAVDYSRVFLGSGMSGYSAAYPYESVYTSPKRLMMQDARDEVLAIYQAAGLGKGEEWKEGEDHIAVELEFLTVLGTRAVDALEQDDEDTCISYLIQQRNFLEDHLMAWYPLMAADIKRFAKTSFYQGLGKLTSGFLDNDKELLDDILSDVDVEDPSNTARQEHIEATDAQVNAA